MLHAGLVVDDDVAVGLGQLAHGGGEQAVGVAVAALALCAAHDQHVKVVTLGEGALQLILHVVLLAHAGGYGGVLIALRLGYHLPNLAEGLLDLDAQDLVEVVVGVGVDGEHRGEPVRAQVIDENAAKGGLAGAALPRNSYRFHLTLLLGRAGATSVRMRKALKARDVTPR